MMMYRMVMLLTVSMVMYWNMDHFHLLSVMMYRYVDRNTDRIVHDL